METGTIALWAFVGYLGAVCTIGLVVARFSSAGMAEFYIGGRRLGRVVVALSAVVSGRSAWLLLGVTGLAYTRGAATVWTVAGYTVVEALLFFFYAPRLRRYAGIHDCLTLPDFFAERLGDSRGRLRALLALVLLVFMVVYVSAQFVSGGKAFSASFELSQTGGVLVTAGIILLYTVLGGFLAVSLTDVVQALLMIVALVALPVVLIVDLGGAGATSEMLRALDPRLLDPTALSFGVALGALGIGLGSPGNPQIVVRYLSIDRPEELRTAAAIGTFWNVLMGAGAVAIGMAGRALMPVADELPGADPEKLYPLLAQEHLHPVLFGLVLASIFAAIMSTADSQLLVAASAVVRDVYQKLMRRGAELGERRLVMLSRIVIVVLVAASISLAFAAEALVHDLVLYAWSGLGAAFGPTSILALYWRRTTRAGVVAGVITGALTTVIWYNVAPLKALVYELIPAFALAFAATIIVSLLGRPPETADRAMREMRQGREG